MLYIKKTLTVLREKQKWTRYLRKSPSTRQKSPKGFRITVRTPKHKKIPYESYALEEEKTPKVSSIHDGGRIKTKPERKL